MSDRLTEFFTSQADFETWLETNHAAVSEIWIKLAKKASGVRSITRAEAVESALCFGWIDGQAASFDEAFWLQRFTPRRPKSTWSLKNRDAATRLIEAGRMRPAGLQAIEAAKQDGRWDRAYASPSNMTTPGDFLEKLEMNPRAKAFFEELDSRNRYAILYRIQDAKREDTRQRRIERYVAMLDAHETIH